MTNSPRIQLAEGGAKAQPPALVMAAAVPRGRFRGSLPPALYRNPAITESLLRGN
jgi:hypothetical protein